MDYIDLLIGFSFFLLEIVILLICYEFIYRKRNLANWTIIDFLKALTGYYFSIIKYTLCSSARDRDMDEFLEKNSEFRFALWEYTAFGGMLLIFLPGIIALLIKYIQLPLFKVVIYLAGISVLLDRLRQSRIDLTYLLNESHKFLFKYQKISNKTRKTEGEGGSENQEIVEDSPKSRVLIIMALSAICSCLLFGLFGKDFILREVLKGFSGKSSALFSPFSVILLLILCIIYMRNNGIWGRVEQGISYWKYLKCKSDIEVRIVEEGRSGLGNLKDEILRMCGLLKMKEVEIGIEDIGVKKVFSVVSYIHMPIIVIGKEVVERSKRLYPQDHFKIIRMLIAHELVHIHYRDAMWKKRVCAVTLIYMGCTACALIIVTGNSNIIWGGITLFLFFILDRVVFRILRDERYWKQVMEFRADRVGMAISHTTPDLLEKVLLCTAEDEEGDEKHERINFVQKMYQRKIEKTIHPDTGRRIYEARREKPWGPGEYFRYLWIIAGNLLMGKGWRV